MGAWPHVVFPRTPRADRAGGRAAGAGDAEPRRLLQAAPALLGGRCAIRAVTARCGWRSRLSCWTCGRTPPAGAVRRADVPARGRARAASRSGAGAGPAAGRGGGADGCCARPRSRRTGSGAPGAHAARARRARRGGEGAGSSSARARAALARRDRAPRCTSRPFHLARVFRARTGLLAHRVRARAAAARRASIASPPSPTSTSRGWRSSSATARRATSAIASARRSARRPRRCAGRNCARSWKRAPARRLEPAPQRRGGREMRGAVMAGGARPGARPRRRARARHGFVEDVRVLQTWHGRAGRLLRVGGVRAA